MDFAFGKTNSVFLLYSIVEILKTPPHKEQLRIRNLEQQIKLSILIVFIFYHYLQYESYLHIPNIIAMVLY